MRLGTKEYVVTMVQVVTVLFCVLMCTAVVFAQAGKTAGAGARTAQEKGAQDALTKKCADDTKNAQQKTCGKMPTTTGDEVRAKNACMKAQERDALEYHLVGKNQKTQEVNPARAGSYCEKEDKIKQRLGEKCAKCEKGVSVISQPYAGGIQAEACKELGSKQSGARAFCREKYEDAQKQAEDKQAEAAAKKAADDAKKQQDKDIAALNKAGAGTCRGGEYDATCTAKDQKVKEQGPSLNNQNVDAVDRAKQLAYGEYDPKQPLTADSKGKIDPVEFAKRAEEKIANSALNGVAPESLKQFGITTGDPKEWARMFTMMQQQESGHRIAPVNADGSLQRFPMTLPGEMSFGPGQFNKGEYGLKTWADVNNPDRVIDAYINVAQQGKLLQYFGSLRRPQETLQHTKWYNTIVKPYL